MNKYKIVINYKDGNVITEVVEAESELMARLVAATMCNPSLGDSYTVTSE